MGLFRLALAFSVLLGHSGGHGLFGLAFLDRQIAVECFFMISGFYMALILNEKYLGPGRYRTFIQQRFLRLYPTYFILLVAILLLDGIVSLVGQKPFASMQPWVENSALLTPGSVALFVGANLLVLGQDIVAQLSLDRVTGHLSFFGHDGHPFISAHWFFLNRPSWSLSVEFFFYLLAPFIVCRSVLVQIAVLLASVGVRWLLTIYVGDATPWTYSFFPPNLGFFVAGSIGYYFYHRYSDRLEASFRTYRWTFGGIFLVFGALVATYSRLPFSHQLYLVFFPVVFVMVPVLFAATRKNRLDRLIGELSYPFYLIHQHVLIYLGASFGGRAQAFYGPACIALTTLLAYLFFHFIETRTELYREELYRKAKSRGEVRKDVPLADDVQPTAGR